MLTATKPTFCLLMAAIDAPNITPNPAGKDWLKYAEQQKYIFHSLPMSVLEATL